MERRKIDYTIFDSDYLYPYEDYVDNCIANEVQPADENSTDYWNYVHEMQMRDRDEFFDILKSDALNVPCMITGKLGLWHGKPTIVPEVFDTIEDAVLKICKVRFDFNLLVRIENGHIVVEQSHHDGTNYFEIHLLSAKGLREVKRPCYEYERDYEPKKWWFKNIYGYLF